ncbi:MAG: VOC family protein [Alphaproteobacteria bacterium]|nr:VOC family protein [Alphaproteobacteria bacterium SS10]
MLSSGFDHTLAISSDLEATAGTYRRLGFTLTPLGRHVGWGTANYCVMFPEDYLELLGIVDPSQPLNGFDQKLEGRGPGLLGLAFATHDAQRVFEGLGQGGLADRQAELSRLLEHPDGTRDVSFRLAYGTTDATPGLSCFWCQHLSRDLIREADWLEHPNGAYGIEGVTLLHPDPASLEVPYRRLLATLNMPDNEMLAGQGRLDVPVGDGCWLRFLSPDRAARRYRGLDPKWLDREGPLVTTILVSDLSETERYLSAQGIAIIPEQGLRLVVGPDDADGTVIEFAMS